MPSRAIIPRFLLPLQGPLWRGVRIPPSQNVYVRFASSSSTSGNAKSEKPIVLEKPARFNPPSHGSRLRRNTMPKHYGPQLTYAEIAAQQQNNYPGVMAPEGSWGHWFWHSRVLHTCITMGTLLVLGVMTFFMNYAFHSPFKDLIPPLSDMWKQPIAFFTTWKKIIVMHEKDKALKAGEHRTNHLDDVAKRKYFMKMHGIETKDPVTMVFGKGEEPSEGELEAAALGKEPPAKTEEELKKAEEKAAQAKKKWFGVF